jgi:hypothetical protein
MHESASVEHYELAVTAIAAHGQSIRPLGYPTYCPVATAWEHSS